MTANTRSAAAKLRARLDHLSSIRMAIGSIRTSTQRLLKLVGGTKALDGFKSRPTEDWHLTIPLAERRERRPRCAGMVGSTDEKHAGRSDIDPAAAPLRAPR